jgi:hypothetical protein
VLLVVAAVAVVTLAVVTFQGRERSGAVTAPRVATGLEPEPVPDDTASTAPVEEEQAAAPPPAPTRQAPTPPLQRDTTPSFEAPAPIESPPDTVSQVAVRDSAPAVAQALALDTTPAIEGAPDTAARVTVGDSAPVAEATAAGGPLQRYARTWVSIRAGRSDGSAAVRTLEPGEAVLVDSLSQGWYRVVVGGRAVGYVDGSYLIIEAP